MCNGTLKWYFDICVDFSWYHISDVLIFHFFIGWVPFLLSPPISIWFSFLTFHSLTYPPYFIHQVSHSIDRHRPFVSVTWRFRQSYEHLTIIDRQFQPIGYDQIRLHWNAGAFGLFCVCFCNFGPSVRRRIRGKNQSKDKIFTALNTRSWRPVFLFMIHTSYSID